jgi:TolB-like protein/tetratricopeptide (TPR) repeat protein
VYRFDGFVVDLEAWRLSLAGREIHLDPRVLKLLIYLIASPGRLVSRQELMDTVWGDTVISESALFQAVARLRRALGDDSATHRYIETVRSQGYRFVAKIEKESVRSLAVLPLNNLTGDSEQDHYTDGVHDLLITELYKLPGLGVTSRQSTIRYRDSRLTMTDIAGELGVDALVEGSLLRKDEKVEVTIQLIDGRSDQHLWAERYTSETPDILNVVEEMATAIGGRLGLKPVPLKAERPTSNRMRSIDPRAIDAFAVGTAHLERLSEKGIATAIGRLESALAIEPKFAQAWVQLSLAHAMQGMFGFVRPQDAIKAIHAAAAKAVDADETFYGGHSALGWAQLWTGDIDGARVLFRKALQINPSACLAIHGDADCLMFEGRMDESLARLRELVHLSPFSVIDNFPLPSHLYMARRYDEAIIAAKAMHSRLPQFSLHRFYSRVYWQQGLFDRALEEERKEFERRGDVVLLAALERGLGHSGPTGAMRAMAESLAARASESYVEPFNIAGAFARAGLVDETVCWLDQAIQNGSFEMYYIAFWPHLDFLRDDVRYPGLLERVYGQKARDIQERASVAL